MKKSKLAIGIMSALLSVGALAACSDVTYSPEGVILTYTGEDGKTISYTADDLFDDEFKESSNYKTVFDAVYKIIIKNYFTEADPDEAEYGKNQLASLKTKAQVAVDGDKQTASKKSESNGTSYDTEFSAILKEKNCENEEELFEHYLYQYEEETFNENFEKIESNMSILKRGTTAADIEKGNPEWNGYFADKVPYHVSHILVKIEDADSTNYANAVVSEANAKKLFTVADALRQNVYNSFADTASLSDDSAARGDLGLVDLDKTAQYIDEFKYALYAFENLYGKTTDAQKSKISIKSDDFDVVSQYNKVNHLKEDESEERLSPEGFATIPYAAFEILQSNAERELGAQDQKVNDGDANFYPRNIFFNHFLNRHSLALVTPENAVKSDASSKYLDTIGTKPADFYKATLTDGAEGTGFHEFTAKDGYAFTGTYLATSIRLGDNTIAYRPILVVRGGSAGEGGYQGIHFIVINRSPFEFVEGASDKSVASLENYYTTYFPSQDRYPTYTVEGVTKKHQTYVNFSGNKDTYQTRADEVKSAIKGYDADGLKHFMFRKYLTAGKLTFNDEKIGEGLAKWMERSEQNKEYNAKIEWENKWISYIENLKQATSIQAKKTISKTCAISFSNHAATITADEITAYRTAHPLDTKVDGKDKTDAEVITMMIGEVKYGKVISADDISEYKLRHPLDTEGKSDDNVVAMMKLEKDYSEKAEAWNEIGGICNDGTRHF